MDERQLYKINKIQKKLLSEWNYAVYVEKVTSALTNGKDLDIILRKKEDLRGIKVTKTLHEIAQNTGIKIPHLINLILRSFELELKTGYSQKIQSVLEIIQSYAGMTVAQKSELLVHILEKLNVNLMEAENDQERLKDHHI